MGKGCISTWGTNIRGHATLACVAVLAPGVVQHAQHMCMHAQESKELAEHYSTGLPVVEGATADLAEAHEQQGDELVGLV